MSNLPHIVRQRLAAPSSGNAGADHPDADLLNAFAERRLAAPERERVLAHLGTCAHCREIVALATPEEAATQAVFTPGRSWWSIRSYQYGAIAAALALVAAGLVLLRPANERSFVSNNVAKVEQPPAMPKPSTPSADTDAYSAAEPAKQREAEQKNEARGFAPLKKDESRTQVGGVGGGRAFGGAIVVQQPTAQPPKELDKLADNYGFQAGNLKARPQEKSENLNRADTRRDQETAQVGSADLMTLPLASKAAPPPPVPAANAAPAVAHSGAPTGGTPPTRSAGMKDLSTAETVEVTSAGTAEAQSNVATGALLAETPAKRRARALSTAAAKDEQAKQNALANDANYNARTVLWRISSGRLQQFDASRNAYDDVAVSGTSRLSIVGSLGTEVWVGGTDGTLYYSNDQGAHWIPVRTGAWSKDATFVGLTPTALRSVEVHLSNGERWRSADGGASWSKYQ